MAKKTVDQLVAEMQNAITVMTNKYVELLLEPEDGELKEQRGEQKKELQKRMAEFKKELKVIQSMKGSKNDKKTEKELKKQQDDIINWVKKMPNSISAIVKTIPKH